MKKRTNYPAEFKTKVVLEILSEESTLNELAAKYEVSPVVLSLWKKEFLERASEVFRKGPSASEKELEQSKEHIAELERKVGQLTYEVDWLKKIYRNPRTRLEEETSLIFRNPGLRLVGRLTCSVSIEAASTGNLLRRRLSPMRIYFSCAESMNCIRIIPHGVIVPSRRLFDAMIRSALIGRRSAD